MPLSKEEQSLLQVFDLAVSRDHDYLNRLAGKLRESLFDKQRAALDDPSRFQVVRCGRRAGKTTYLACRHLIDALTAPDIVSITIHKSRNSRSAEAFKLEVRRLCELHKIPFRENLQEAFFSFTNGSLIIIRGAETVGEVDKLRGGKHRLASVDEAAFIRPIVLRYLIDEVIEPALYDYRGVLLLASTPSHALVGPFYDYDMGGARGWSRHYWNMTSNPHIPDAAAQMLEERERKGWAEDNPVYLRERLGQWVLSDDVLIIPISAERNFVDALPPGPDWLYSLSIDIGFNEPCAFVLGAWSPSHPNAYIVRAYKKSGLTPSDVGGEIRELQKQFTLTRVIMDTAGAGIGYKTEIEKRFSLSITSAKKQNKTGNILFMQDDVRTGRVKVLRDGCNDLVEEWTTIPWNEDKTGPDDRYDDHCFDAANYLLTDLRHWQHKEKPAPKTPTRRDRVDELVAANERRLFRRGPREILYEG